jgi:hypothetical protein
MVEHGAGEFTLTRDQVGTRHAIALFRTFVDASNADDVKAANALQDRLAVKQADKGRFEAPDWDGASLKKLRDAINVLAATKTDSSGMFGVKSQLNPIDHLLGTASGWGGNPKSAAMYDSFNNVGAKKAADGSITIHFGGDPTKQNFLPVSAGWNYTVRLYQPRQALLDGTWKFPAPQAV